MKKLIVCLLLLAAALSLIACGKTADPAFAEISEDGFAKICEYNGAKIYCTPALERSDSGDLKLTVRIDATECQENIAVRLTDCTVNGFSLNTPSMYMTNAGSESEIYSNLWTSAMAAYGVKNYGTVKAGFAVYTFDPDTYETCEAPVATVAPLSFDTGDSASDTELSGLDDLIFDRDGIKVYSVQTEGDFYSVLNLCVVNENDRDAVVTPAELTLNGETQNADFSSYAISVGAKGTAFSTLPLSNFNYNAETGVTEKLEVTSFALDFDVT